MEFEYERKGHDEWTVWSPNPMSQFLLVDAAKAELKLKLSNPEMFRNDVNVECLVIGPDKVHVAVKRYQKEQVKTWWDEAEEIERFGESQHTATSPALARFETDGKCYVIFPWTKHGSLRDFWYKFPDSTKLASNVELWLLQQCFGITHALLELHGDLLAPSCRAKSYVLLGDIKPEHIVIFESDQNKIDNPGPIVSTDLGQLKLTYFGRSKFRESPARAFSPTYQPPETGTFLSSIRMSTDIWYLGCVFLEFCAWYVLGAAGLEAFIGAWLETIKKFPHQNAFFSAEFRQLPDKFMLNPAVTKLITDLRGHPRSTMTLHAFLDLIETKMLVHEDKRAAALVVTVAIWNLLRDFSDDATTSQVPMARGESGSQAEERLRLTLYDAYNLGWWRVQLEKHFFALVDWYQLSPVNSLQSARQYKLTWRYKDHELFIILDLDETKRCLDTALPVATKKTPLPLEDSPEGQSQSLKTAASSNHPSSSRSQRINNANTKGSQYQKNKKEVRKKQSSEPRKIIQSESHDPNLSKECYFCVDKASFMKRGTYFSTPVVTQELADDAAFFKLLKKRLKASSGYSSFGFVPLMAYNAVNLCQFSFMNDNSDLVAAFDLEEFPRDESVICAGYSFGARSSSVTDSLPVDIYMRKLGKTILAGIERPDDGWGRRNVLNALPKRQVPPTLPKTYETTGWGFHVRLGANFSSVAFYVIGLVLLGLTFVPFWLVLIDNKDLQNAFTPSSTMFSVAALLLAWAALLQNK